MTIQLSDDKAEALLRAASKSGYKSVVQDLLDAGVKASVQQGAAVLLADFYGHKEVADLLRRAIEREKAAASLVQERADGVAKVAHRSTVREKVVLLLNDRPVESVQGPTPTKATPPAPAPAPEAAAETSTAPRRAGWWSRRFGGGE